MENKSSIKEEFERAVKEKDIEKIEALVQENPKLVKDLPEGGEFGDNVAMMGDYVKMLDDFAVGIKTVGGLPDTFFLNDALVVELKTAARNRLNAQCGSNISEEEKENVMQQVNVAIDARAKKVKIIAERSNNQQGASESEFDSYIGME